MAWTVLITRVGAFQMPAIKGVEKIERSAMDGRPTIRFLGTGNAPLGPFYLEDDITEFKVVPS